MAGENKIIECSICGHKMAIPPQYANVAGKCTVCGAVVNQQTQPTLDVDLVNSIAPTVSAPPPKAPPKKKGEKKKLTVSDMKDTALAALLWGAVGVIVIGGGLAVGYGLLRRSFSDSSASFQDGLLEGITLGLPIGLFFGATWGVVRQRELEGPGGALAGFIFGCIVSGIYHPIENLLVAQSDLTLWQTSLVGALGGGFFGFIVGYFRDYEW